VAVRPARRVMEFHHARILADVRYGIVRAAPGEGLADEHQRDFEAAYAWLERRLGFWPLFLAVGGSDADRRMTGYQDQWRKPLPGEQTQPSRVLFSWAHAPPGAVLMDFDAWHIVLNSVERVPGDPEARRVQEIGVASERALWKRSWSLADWLRAARRGAPVQAVVPELDLRSAAEVWCRNREERRALVRLGFDASRVRTRRLTVE